MTQALRVAAFAVALCAVFYAWGAAAASAAPVPTWATPCASDLDTAACERLTYIASELSAIDDATSTTAANTAAGSSSSVALSPDDSSRLDASWWGIWFIAGLLMCAITVPPFLRAFRWLQA